MREFENLKQVLEQNKKWPVYYMFKFIVPNTDGKVDKVKAIMPDHGQLSFKHTKNLKFVSVSCKAYMPTPQSIIEVTEDAVAIEGVIML